MGKSHKERFAELTAQLDEINKNIADSAKSVRRAAMDLAKNMLDLASNMENEQNGSLPTEYDMDQKYSSGWVKNEVARLKTYREDRYSRAEEYRILRHKLAKQERKTL